MSEDRIAAPIRAFIARACAGHALNDDDDIFALGFANSLFALQLVAFVEREFRVDIDSADLDLANFRSVRALTGLVQRKLAG